jgi:acetylornithine deacetylase/succinyl-diaminopimelate desuccinylase-like protein
MKKLDNERLMASTSLFWDEEILPSLAEYVKIPNKSPLYDPNWQKNGFMAQAMEHVVAWIKQQDVPGLLCEVHQLQNKTPTLLLELPGTIDETVLIYGHLDKQPEFDGWSDDLGPWKPVFKNDRLYGRGGADDGYAIYSAISLIKSLLGQDLDLPRIVILIECSEESGSPDLADYMNELGAQIGEPGLVIALDSACGNYDQLWLTTSLRGMIIGELKIEVLEQGAHSGMAGGIVASSFRIMRQTISKIENEATGEITPSFLNEQIPESRRNEAISAGEILKDSFKDMYTFAGQSKPLSSDPTELVLNNTWLASLEVTGIDGIPDVQNAGNVLRPYTTAKLALRLPPTTDVIRAAIELENLLTSNAPQDCNITFSSDAHNPGWHSPITVDHLEESVQEASQAFFSAPAVSMGCGGSIPFMEFLANKLPDAQFVVTGVLGPLSNAHGPNEFLHIPTGKKVTACTAKIIYDWGQAFIRAD